MRRYEKTFRRGYLVNTAVLIAVYALCVVLSVVLADSGSFRLTVVPSIWQCCYLIILAASLNLVLGFMGQLSLGHCGFMAIGAYTAALMSLAFQRSGVYDEKSGAVFILIIFLCIICAGVLAAVFGVLVGIPALRLKGDYLAIITLGFGLIIVNVINTCPSRVRTAWPRAWPAPRCTRTAWASAPRPRSPTCGWRWRRSSYAWR